MAREELIVGIGADTSDLQQEIRRSARDIEGLADQLASLAAGSDSGPVLQDFIEGIQAAKAELGATAEVAAAVDVLLAELGTGSSRSAEGAFALARGLAGAAQQQGTLSAETRAFLATNAKLQAGFQESARQAQALARATAQIETSTQWMNRAFQESAKQAQILSREIRNSVSGSEAMARGIANISAQNAVFATSTGKATRGLNMLRGGLASVVASNLSLQSSLASVAQGLLFSLGAGGGIIVAVLGGLFAASKAYEAFTEDSRKAKEETDKLREALDRLRESFRDPAAVATEQFEAQRRVVAALSKELADLTAQQAQGPLEQGQPDVVLARQLRRAQELKQLQVDLAEETRRLAAAATLVGNISTDTDDARIDRATMLLSLGIANREEQERLVQTLADLRAQEARLSGQDQKTQERRLKIRQQILAIEQVQAKAVELDTKPAQDAARQLREEIQATSAALDRAQAAAAALSQPFTLRLDVGAALEDVRALQVRVDEMIARFQRLGLGTGDLEGLRKALRQTLAEADPTTLEAVAKAVEVLSERLGTLRGDLGGVSGQQEAIRGTASLLVIEYGKLVAEIERQGGALQASTALLEQAGKAVAALGPDSAPFTIGLGLAIDRLKEAEQRLREFTAFGATLPAFETTVQMDIEAARAQVQSFLKESQDRLDQGVFTAVLNVEISEDPTSTEFLLRAMDALGKEGADLRKRFRETRTEAEKMRDAFFDVSDTVGAFRQIGEELGFIDESGRRALDTIQGLAEAAANLAQGDVLGGILGGRTSIAGLFGKSESQREAERLQQQNTDALQALRDEISGLTTSLDSLARAQEATAGISARDFDFARTIQTVPGGIDLGLDIINQQLKPFGLTIEELDRQAEDLGFNVIADDGRLVAGAFETLTEVLGITIEELTHFGTSISDQRLIEETRASLGGVDPGNVVAQLERERQILLTTAKDVLALIKLISDAINEMADATNAATDAMLNVPTGFKLAAARFAADLGEVSMRPFAPPLVPVMAGQGLTEVSTAPSQTSIGEINISIDGTNKDPQQVAREVVRELRNLSMAKFGTTDRWGEL